MRTKIYLLLITCLLLPAICFGDDESKQIQTNARRDRELQTSFLQFKELMPAKGSGKQEFQKFRLENPVSIEGTDYDYYGFRFTVPQRTNHEDLVWAFVMPNTGMNFTGWYILPQTGDTLLEAVAQGRYGQGFTGFTNYLYFPRAEYPELNGLLPTSAKLLVMQHFVGTSLEDGKQYLIWFSFKSQKKIPNWISLEFEFANLTEKEANNRKVMEKLLGLHRGQPKASPSPSAN